MGCGLSFDEVEDHTLHWNLESPELKRALMQKRFKDAGAIVHAGSRGNVKFNERSREQVIEVDPADGSNALHWAASVYGAFDILSWLIQEQRGFDFDINEQNAVHGDTALHIAIRRNIPDAVTIIMRQEMNFSEQLPCNKDGHTALHLAMALNRHELLPLLVSEDGKWDKCDPDSVLDKWGRPAIFAAIETDAVESLQCLIETFWANPDAPSRPVPITGAASAAAPSATASPSVLSCGAAWLEDVNGDEDYDSGTALSPSQSPRQSKDPRLIYAQLPTKKSILKKRKERQLSGESSNSSPRSPTWSSQQSQHSTVGSPPQLSTTVLNLVLPPVLGQPANTGPPLQEGGMSSPGNNTTISNATPVTGSPESQNNSRDGRSHGNGKLVWDSGIHSGYSTPASQIEEDEDSLHQQQQPIVYPHKPNHGTAGDQWQTPLEYAEKLHSRKCRKYLEKLRDRKYLTTGGRTRRSSAMGVVDAFGRPSLTPGAGGLPGPARSNGMMRLTSTGTLQESINHRGGFSSTSTPTSSRRSSVSSSGGPHGLSVGAKTTTGRGFQRRPSHNNNGKDAMHSPSNAPWDGLRSGVGFGHESNVGGNSSSSNVSLRDQKGGARRQQLQQHCWAAFEEDEAEHNNNAGDMETTSVISM